MGVGRRKHVLIHVMHINQLFSSITIDIYILLAQLMQSRDVTRINVIDSFTICHRLEIEFSEEGLFIFMFIIKENKTPKYIYEIQIYEIREAKICPFFRMTQKQQFIEYETNKSNANDDIDMKQREREEANDRGENENAMNIYETYV